VEIMKRNFLIPDEEAGAEMLGRILVKEDSHSGYEECKCCYTQCTRCSKCTVYGGKDSYEEIVESGLK